MCQGALGVCLPRVSGIIHSRVRLAPGGDVELGVELGDSLTRGARLYPGRDGVEGVVGHDFPPVEGHAHRGSGEGERHPAALQQHHGVDKFSSCLERVEEKV